MSDEVDGNNVLSWLERRQKRQVTKKKITPERTNAIHPIQNTADDDSPAFELR